MTKRKLPKCKRGYNCGYTCIAKSRRCSDEKMAQTKKILDELANTIKDKNTRSSSYFDKDVIDRVLASPGGARDPRNLMEIGEAIANKHGFFDFAEQLSQEGMTPLVRRLGKEFLKNVKSDIVKIQAERGNKSKEGFPEEYEEIFDVYGKKTTDEITSIKKEGQRAYVIMETGELNLGSHPYPGTIWHELGHLLEKNPDIQAASQRILKERSATGQIETLNKIVGGPVYEANEIAFRGYFPLGAYMGKYYHNGSTEVLSMAAESLSDEKKLINAVQKDRELVLMVLGAILANR